MWPGKNTAFLVIHGAGAHSPLETLDLFARNFCSALERLSAVDQRTDLEIRHCRQSDPHQDRHTGDSNFVSIDAPGKARIEIHEYTWDFRRTTEIALEDVMKWMNQMVEGARNFYDHNPKQQSEVGWTRPDIFDSEGRYRPNRYLSLISGSWRYFGYLVRLADFLRIPFLGNMVKALRLLYRRFARDFFGDLVTYLCIDVRSRDFAVRRRIQKGAVDRLKLLLSSERIEQVVLVGHSLGSVIAYDALNLLNHELNERSQLTRRQREKPLGLVTFGSPLDKVVFTYYSDAKSKAHIHWQILDHLRSYRSRSIGIEDPEPLLSGNPLKPLLDSQSIWINFYHTKDPVAGYLDAYRPDGNIRLDMATEGVVDAHTFYWRHEPLYDRIIDAFA